MELHELVNQVDGFDRLVLRDKIKIFAWFLHTHKGREIFGNADIRACFIKLHLADPNVAKYMSRMVEYREIVKSNGGLKLERSARMDLDRKYGTHDSVIAVNKILTDLRERVHNIDERSFFWEALKCYRTGAYRACIVMTWNLAYAHLLDWILKDSHRLTIFNESISKRYPKKSAILISNYDEFVDELKEREVIEICNSGNLFSSNISKILREKLDRRNIAAHPSTIVVIQSQADDVVTDLVNNVVLALR